MRVMAVAGGSRSRPFVGATGGPRSPVAAGSDSRPCLPAAAAARHHAIRRRRKPERPPRGGQAAAAKGAEAEEKSAGAPNPPAAKNPPAAAANPPAAAANAAAASRCQQSWELEWSKRRSGEQGRARCHRGQKWTQDAGKKSARCPELTSATR